MAATVHMCLCTSDVCDSHSDHPEASSTATIGKRRFDGGQVSHEEEVALAIFEESCIRRPGTRRGRLRNKVAKTTDRAVRKLWAGGQQRQNEVDVVVGVNIAPGMTASTAMTEGVRIGMTRDVNTHPMSLVAKKWTSPMITATRTKTTRQTTRENE